MSAIEEVLYQDVAQVVKTILIVEDDDAIGTFLEYAIDQETRHRPFVTTGAVEAREAVKHIKPDLLLLDYYLAYGTGIDLYDELHALQGFEAIPAIILSAGDLKGHYQEIEQRHLRLVSKPIDLDELLNTIDSMLA